jgi:hypothetical protein
MPASRILALPRASRLAIVASGTKNAAAISAVGRPQTQRRVSAIRVAGSSAGWQHMKISASSSPGSRAALPGAAPGGSVIAAASFSPRLASRRCWSMALRRATAISHPAGLAGPPFGRPLGQRRRAGLLDRVLGQAEITAR